MSSDEVRKLAAIMFTDMVGYSALSQRNDKRALELLEEHRQILREIFPRFHGAEIKTIGDAFLVEFNSALEAAQCAIDIQRALAKRNADAPADRQIEVRIGIHIGDVVHRAGDVYGDGVNIASRIQPLANAGGVCVSMDVERQIRNAVETRFEKLAPTELKNISVPMDLFRIVLPWERPGTPVAKIQARPKSASRTFVPAAITLVLFFIIGLSWWFVHQKSVGRDRRALQTAEQGRLGPVATGSVPIPQKSIAVLPFENLSEDKSNAFFADGVQDEILTDLSKIADLKVISRSSVMHYKSGVERNLRKIGEELGVAHLLEGSVQRSGNRVRVNAQLIDARNDTHIWAQTYDRDLSDVFAIQSEIAKAIADQLQAKLSPSEQSAIIQPPTRDVAAFDLYTRGRTLMLNVSFTNVADENLRQAVDLFQQAITRDPKFVAAYASMADAHDQLYAVQGDHTAERLALAEAAIARLRELAPEAGQTHLAIARHRYFAFRDYAGARAELTAAAKYLPNEPAILALSAFIDRRVGKWDDSERELSQAIDRDPRNTFFMQQGSLTYGLLRRFSEMAAVLDRALAVDPENVETRIGRAQVELHWHANTKPVHDVIKNALERDPASARVAAENWIALACCERDPEALSRALAALEDRRFSFMASVVLFDADVGQALLSYLRKDSAGFKEALLRARTAQQEYIRQQPGYAPPVCTLALIDAMLGNKEEAVSEGRRATELIPIAKDALIGGELTGFFAGICAWAGEKDLAFEQLAKATSSPSFVSYGHLKLHPMWDPLRGDPRFEQIVASVAPKE